MHNFSESLRSSHAANELAIWREIYSKAFPGFLAMIDHREDGEHQRAGIDRSVIMPNSKQILVDEKVRFKNKKTNKIYEDILLEYWSDEQRQVPGWACKPLRADFICYAIAPLGKAYLLPVSQMQQAFALNREDWIAKYPRVPAENKDGFRFWLTVSVAIPVDVLFKAIGACLRVSFAPVEEIDYL